MTELQKLARKACHYKHCLTSETHFDGLCCGKILSALEEAVASERAVCAKVAREWSEGGTTASFVGCYTAHGEGQECGSTDGIAAAIETRDDGEATWLVRLRAERDVALALLCDLPHDNRAAPCEHCGGCLSAINLAVDVWSTDNAERRVEDSALGCVACYRNMPLATWDGLMGHNLPAFKQCPVKRAELS